MAYSLEALRDDCYDNSTVLKNKFNIQDGAKLDLMERTTTTLRIAQAMTEIVFENVDFLFYKNLHKYVFGDIYEWAGNIRRVEMSKRGTRFCSVDEIENRGNNLFKRLRNNNYLNSFTGDDFINEFTELYCNLNYLHPFREGNGRTQRLFLNMLLLFIGKQMDFSKIDKDLLMIATIKSVSGDVFMLRDIFRENITDRSI